jgi:L-threonylcarbamoyladenylate synthase
VARIGKDIAFAKSILESSDLVAIPTETVYGLAGNAFDAKAIARIFEAKNRPYFDPLIAHTSSISRAKTFVQSFPEKAELLAKKFWPGPLTLLLPKKEIIPDIVTSGLDRVAVRVPNHPVALKLLRSLEFPLAAPSANPFGYISPTQSFHVQAQLGEKIDYILEGGACAVGIESTIVGFEKDQPVIYRLGGISVEEIERVIGKVKINAHSSGDPVSPGMLKSHYAPFTRVEIGNIEALQANNMDQKYGILAFSKKYLDDDSENQYILSPDGDLNEAATRLFSGLRHLDALDLDIILTEYVPDEGLGRGINDRLRRASIK